MLKGQEDGSPRVTSLINKETFSATSLTVFCESGGGSKVNKGGWPEGRKNRLEDLNEFCQTFPSFILSVVQKTMERLDLEKAWMPGI